ncbi:hypothetical protein FOL46_004832 [Perkinsus olseni]|uniref:Protein arginine methyltransferase 10 n=1 Tax=Perkinsus olseni TaxID=32597 RepID=A0A7J6LVE7_PEROL|nr:hypothetical protein FOL46_004832 [Perkinsus olseni]
MIHFFFALFQAPLTALAGGPACQLTSSSRVAITGEGGNERVAFKVACSGVMTNRSASQAFRDMTFSPPGLSLIHSSVDASADGVYDFTYVINTQLGMSKPGVYTITVTLDDDPDVQLHFEIDMCSGLSCREYNFVVISTPAESVFDIPAGEEADISIKATSGMPLAQFNENPFPPDIYCAYGEVAVPGDSTPRGDQTTEACRWFHRRFSRIMRSDPRIAENRLRVRPTDSQVGRTYRACWTFSSDRNATLVRYARDNMGNLVASDERTACLNGRVIPAIERNQSDAMPAVKEEKPVATGRRQKASSRPVRAVLKQTMKAASAPESLKITGPSSAGDSSMRASPLLLSMLLCFAHLWR